ncbi:peptidase M23 [Dyella flava]|nr:peptidase M23 [Dyella flava]
MHRETVQQGDSAPTLAQQAGVDASQYANWAKHASPRVLQSLQRMRPGDRFEVCVSTRTSAGNAIYNLAVVRDKQGRLAAEQAATQTPSESIASLSSVTGDVLLSPSLSHVTGDALLSPAPHPSTHTPQQPVATLAAVNPHAPNGWIIRLLPPGMPLSKALSQSLGHRPVVDAIVAYAKHVWNMPERIPSKGQYTVAIRPSESGHELAYFQFEDRGRTQKVYHYVDDAGHDYVVSSHGRGFEVLKPMPPVHDARMSSGWGWRIQPVLGGNEFHQGVDYAAPKGTPVRAAMDGVVALSEWRGEYGRVVEVKHAHDLATRYGHLSSFAASIHPGVHVHRGEIIGYVGSTGLSTGPHLYYEVWDHGVRVNPLTHTQWTVVASLDAQERRSLMNYIDDAKAAP